MDDALRHLVWQRAASQCEYCRLHQDEYEYQTFHIEHIIAKQHGGKDEPDNHCLACSECTWSKGTNLAGLLDGKLVAPFHPRRQQWKRHFRWDATMIVGKTKCGIVTVQVLNMNSSSRLLLRECLLLAGRFPPAE